LAGVSPFTAQEVEKLGLAQSSNIEGVESEVTGMECETKNVYSNVKSLV